MFSSCTKMRKGQTFHQIFSPLLSEFGHYYWVFWNPVSPPGVICWDDDEEAFVDSHHLHVLESFGPDISSAELDASTPFSLFSPGLFPRASRWVDSDDTEAFAFSGEELAKTLKELIALGIRRMRSGSLLLEGEQGSEDQYVNDWIQFLRDNMAFYLRNYDAGFWDIFSREPIALAKVATNTRQQLGCEVVSVGIEDFPY